MHQATSRSLVLLDEIGRGTATFDGLSIAWAVAEHLTTNPKARPRTLFATHYHELTDLADRHPGVVNYHVAAREWRDDIVFLRKVEPGRSDRSYGIQVAKLAGLPPATVASSPHHPGRARARRAVPRRAPLVQRRPGERTGGPARTLPAEAARQIHRDVAERIAALDLERLTPLEALVLLGELKEALAD